MKNKIESKEKYLNFFHLKWKKYIESGKNVAGHKAQNFDDIKYYNDRIWSAE